VSSPSASPGGVTTELTISSATGGIIAAGSAMPSGAVGLSVVGMGTEAGICAAGSIAGVVGATPATTGRAGGAPAGRDCVALLAAGAAG
jgi:hypothetical protein